MTQIIRIMSMVLLLASSLPAFADSKTDYLLHCSGCHLPDGTGAPSSDVPSLHNDLGKLASMQEGRRYLARVPGSSQAFLSDEGLAAVLNWVLSEFNATTLDDGFIPLTAKEVKAARIDVLMDPLKFREELWQNYNDS